MKISQTFVALEVTKKRVDGNWHVPKKANNTARTSLTLCSANKLQPLRRTKMASQLTNQTIGLPKYATYNLIGRPQLISKTLLSFPPLTSFGNEDKLGKERIVGNDIDFQPVSLGKDTKV